MSTVPRGASRPRPHAAVPFSILFAGLGACAAPPAQPLEPAALARAVRERDALPEPTPQEVAAALALLAVDPLDAVVDPPEPDLAADARAWWHARAATWSPQVRVARQGLQQALARADSAGRPSPLELGAEVRELEDLDAHTRVALTVDVIGLLGLEPAAAARALADAQARAALGELDLARWNARFEVDAQRARLAAAGAALVELERLRAEAGAGLRRLEILERHGRVGRSAAASARIALAQLETARAAAVERASLAREALAVVAGLPDGSQALALVSPAVLCAPEPLDVDVDAEALFARLPQLRLALLEYALAEARLRAVAAERWPSLNLGPQLTWSHPDLLLGAMASAGLAWPGALDGRLREAHLAREAARERAEDALAAALARRAGAGERLSNARVQVERGAGPALESSARRWTAARAAFAVDAAALEDWSEALRERAFAVEAFAQSRAAVAVARLELEQSQGGGERLTALAAAGEVRP